MRFIRKRLLVCALGLACGASAFARSGGEGGGLVGNGAGLAEAEVVYAYERLASSIDYCLNMGQCALLPDERVLLMRIREHVATLPPAYDKLAFYSEKQLPGFFNTEGDSDRVAKTELGRVNGLIYFNTDALYERGMVRVDLPVATSILVHELGHQIGEASHAKLDTLGGRVRFGLERRIDSKTHPEADFTYRVLLGSNATQPSNVFLRMGQKSFDLTKAILAALQCPAGALPMSMQLENTHWILEEPADAARFGGYLRIYCVQHNAAPSVRNVGNISFIRATLRVVVPLERSLQDMRITVLPR